MINFLKFEIKVFFTALMFYTRIPCPGWVGHSEELLNQATRYFPLIGYIVGALSSFVFLVSNYFFGIYTAIILSLIAAILTTGAFHEDGFADSCDGFGGGWTKEKILTIMKDSRIGAYGVVGLIVLFSLKIALLGEILMTIEQQYLVVLAFFISAHSLSRFFASTMIFQLPYAREADDSKVKPVAKRIDAWWFFFSFLTAFISISGLAFCLSNYWILLTLLPLFAVIHLLGQYFKKWIGGYTGDCLGAAQQVSEIVFYLSIAIIWKFTL